MTMADKDCITQSIWDQYAPRTKDGEIDPLCLYVGPLMSGMGIFMPELADLVLRTRDEERNNQSMRVRIKHFIQDLVDPRTGTRSGSAGGEIAGTGFGALVFQREGGNPVNLTRRTVLEEEPGAILNSIEIATNTKGEDIVVSTVREPGPLAEVLPKIREDLRFQLHYLMAGDRFKAQFSSRGRTRSLEYSLRPLSEGNSLISAPLASIRNEVF